MGPNYYRTRFPLPLRDVRGGALPFLFLECRGEPILILLDTVESYDEFFAICYLLLLIINYNTDIHKVNEKTHLSRLHIPIRSS